jgi:hypothetical protein
MTNFIEKSLFELANIRVGQLFENANLSCECSGFPRVNVNPIPVSGALLDLVRLDHLDGKPLTTHTVHGFIDGSKGAFAKLDAEIIECMNSLGGGTSGYEPKDIS